MVEEHMLEDLIPVVKAVHGMAFLGKDHFDAFIQYGVIFDDEYSHGDIIHELGQASTLSSILIKTS